MVTKRQMVTVVSFRVFQSKDCLLHLLPARDGHTAAVELFHHCQLGEYLVTTKILTDKVGKRVM